MSAWISLVTIDPYRFIALGGMSLVAVAAFLGIYTYLNPRRKLPTLAILTLFLVLPLISIFRTGTYQSGDLTHQAYFTAIFYESLKDGTVLPRWADILNFNYGNPMFLFTYPLPYFLAAAAHGIGLGFINSIKAVLIFTYLLSGWGAYAWGKKHFSNTGAAILALMYTYAPYHLIDMHYRVAMGEMTAMAVMPFVLWELYRWTKQPNMKNLAMASATVALLVLSHQAVALISLPFIAGYTWFLKSRKGWREKLRWGGPFVIGILLSTFYWWPVVYEMQFTREPMYSQTVEFSPFLWSIVSPWKLGLLWQGHMAETANVIGLVQGVSVLISAVLLIKGKIKIQRILFLICSIFFVADFFLMQKTSWPLWQVLPLIKHLQFAYRWNAVLILLTATMGAIVWENLGKFKTRKLLVFLVSAITVPTILNWGNRKMLPPMSDLQIYQGLPGNALYNPYGPATPKWTNLKDPWQKGFPVSPIEAVTGEIEAVQLSRSSVKHTYQVRMNRETLIRENTYYFPGWKVTVDGQKVELAGETYATGIINFSLPAGVHRVEVTFENTPDRVASAIISQGTAVAILLAIVWELRRKMLYPPKGK